MGLVRLAAVAVGAALVVAGCADADARAAIPTNEADLSSLASFGTAAPAGAGPTLAPLTPTDPSRLPADEAAAIDALGAVASPLFPLAGHAHGHGATGQAESHALTAAQQSEFDRQWQTAAAAVSGLDSIEEATAAGYTQASFTAPGVGVHWVKWSLIDRPFDPATPSMLLFDPRSEPPALAGFSYWIRSGAEPTGFAGPNDTWHQHSGLCVANGWVDREDVADASDCAGSYFGGRDLWMLHAWVVPEWRNRWGEFATTNPLLCPPVASTPDLSRCPEPGA
ncbi:MAG: hypothetical protein EHM63_02680 [Actinobacteria bacterium]|nr:MAG: hypothetical protein EHM63_02680 [Actinomycetota bacterium]